MTIKEAEQIKNGDLVRVINTHKDKKSKNDECIWTVIGITKINRSRGSIAIFDLRLIKGTYKCWDQSGAILEEGAVIKRTNRALKRMKIVTKRLGA